MSDKPDRSRQDAWVARVLGVSRRESGQSADLAARWTAAESAFAAAAQLVDAQIDALRTVLRRTDDPSLRMVAESGLAGLAAPMRQELEAAMAAAGHTADSLRNAAPALNKAVEAFRTQLGQDPRIAACDRNPFGVAVSIRAGYAAALEQIVNVCTAAL